MSVHNVGGNVDSWCGPCKMMLAHTIEAVVGAQPARVHCNTCKAQHNYKGFPPGEAPKQVRAKAARGGRAGGPGVAKASHYHELLKSKNMALGKRYSPKDRYVPGDVVEHPSFGIGVATAIKDGIKIEVLFEDGPKVLMHGR